jgi:hypothetical protein
MNGMMTEQQMVDGLNRLKDVHYQRYDNPVPDSCGHFNCQYHGICLLSEYRNLFSDDKRIVRLIETSIPNDRETLCRWCQHRCKSVKYKDQHTPSWLGGGTMLHEAECPCREGYEVPIGVKQTIPAEGFSI